MELILMKKISSAKIRGICYNIFVKKREDDVKWS